jgi:hypothetical protein
MLIQNQVGPLPSTAVVSIPPGTTVPGRAGQLGDLIESNHSPNLYEATYRKSPAGYSAVLTFPSHISGGFVSSYGGLAIANPPGSSINCALVGVSWTFASMSFSASQTPVIGLMAGYHASQPTNVTSSVTIKSSFVGSAISGQVVAASNCVFPATGSLVKVFSTQYSGSLAVRTQAPLCYVELLGSLVLPPGGYAALYASTSSYFPGLQAEIDWVEMPV